MASLARQISKEQVIHALEYIIQNNIKLIESTKYNLIYKGKKYPPKEVVRWAADLAQIKGWQDMTLYGGDNTNEPLRKMGFTIVSKNSNDPHLEIINNYKKLISKGNEDELYKWELINRYCGKPDLDAEDFIKEITSINYSNLIYHNGITVRNHIAKARTEDYRKCFQLLFNEELDLYYRIVKFQDEVSTIYKEMGETLNHHHDERTISTFLTFKYPDKYPLYKNSFYSSYCKKIGIKQAKKNERYIHYISLLKDFITNYLKQDEELLAFKNEFLNENCYPDDQNLIFAQDILYRVLDKEQNEENEIIKNEKNQSIEMTKFPLNQILYGPPGTGKTYHTINKAIEIANPSFDLNQDRSIVKAEYNRLVNEGQIAFTTFHQSMSYEDFIEGIKPEIEENEEGSKSVIYEVKDGIFKSLCKNSNKEEQNINEDNFEESWNKLIELVKEQISEEKLLKLGSWEYSLSSKESLKYSSLNSPSQYSFTITKKNILDTYQNKQARPSGAFQKDMVDIVNYMKVNFGLIDYQESHQLISIAKNHVLIIDEINRGNVSQIFGELITLIEESKRLGNKEELKVTLPYSKEEFGVPNNLYIIGTMNTADRSVEALDTALRRRFSFTEMLPNPAIIESQNFTDFPRAKIMKKINERIELLLDRNYMLGHAYFMKENFKHSFENEIIPLLQEYFYNDYSKIGLVLGKGFVRAKAISLQNVTHVFADFDTIHDIDLIKTYELIPFNEINFEEALSLLIH